MRAKIGDVVIDKTYNKKGNLAIVVGEGISQPILIDHKGGITMDKLMDYFAVWDELEVIGHIDLEKVWEEAVLTADRKTEPTISKMEQVEPQTCSFSDCDNFKNPDYARCIECKRKQIMLKDEPQTERSSE